MESMFQVVEEEVEGKKIGIPLSQSGAAIVKLMGKVIGWRRAL